MSEDPAAQPAPPSSPEGAPTASHPGNDYAAAPPIGGAYPVAERAPQPGEPSRGDAPGAPLGDAPTAIDNPGVLPVVARKPRRLRWLLWTAGSLVAAALVGTCAYLIVVSQQWSDRVDDLTTISQDLGQQVADQTAARQTAEEKATTLQSQLDTATTRITDLANEEANAVDHEDAWIDIVDAMISCEQGWVDHSTVLKGQKRYTDISTAGAEAELVAYCNGVIDDYNAFKTEIGK